MGGTEKRSIDNRQMTWTCIRPEEKGAIQDVDRNEQGGFPRKPRFYKLLVPEIGEAPFAEFSCCRKDRSREELLCTDVRTHTECIS